MTSQSDLSHFYSILTDSSSPFLSALLLEATAHHASHTLQQAHIHPSKSISANILAQTAPAIIEEATLARTLLLNHASNGQLEGGGAAGGLSIRQQVDTDLEALAIELEDIDGGLASDNHIQNHEYEHDELHDDDDHNDHYDDLLKWIQLRNHEKKDMDIQWKCGEPKNLIDPLDTKYFTQDSEFMATLLRLDDYIELHPTHPVQPKQGIHGSLPLGTTVLPIPSLSHQVLLQQQPQHPQTLQPQSYSDEKMLPKSKINMLSAFKKPTPPSEPMDLNWQQEEEVLPPGNQNYSSFNISRKNSFHKVLGLRNSFRKSTTTPQTSDRFQDEPDLDEERNPGVTGFINAGTMLQKVSSSNNNNHLFNKKRSLNDVEREVTNAVLGGKRKLFQKPRPLVSCTSRDPLPTGSENPDIPEVPNVEEKLVAMVINEIMDSAIQVTWDDIAGLEFAKKCVMEAVIWPMQRPDLFRGLRGPPKGLLLFGPPGTGKTMIGRAIASKSGAKFFNISASSLTSKWVGESEKLVRALFAVARFFQPSVIFIDEIDSMLTQRTDSDQESSRRLKTEFLVQMDGVGTSREDRILVVGATNRPQELDEAARRRLVKRLYIPLPDYQARASLIQRLLKDQKLEISKQDYAEITKLTDGYSGSDIYSLCAEASLGPLRDLCDQLENICVENVRPILLRDFEEACRIVRASVGENELDNYLDWNSKYGSFSIEK